MNIKTLKEEIEKNTIKVQPLIFICTTIAQSFIAKQYIAKIAALNDCALIYNSEYIEPQINDWLPYSQLQIVVSDKFIDINFKPTTMFIVKKISAESKEKFKDICIDMPQIEDWQIEDYIKTQCGGLLEEQIKELLKDCNKDPFKIDTYVKQLSLFSTVEQSIIYKKLKTNILLSETNCLYGLVDAVVHKDTISVSKILKDYETSNLKLDAFALMTLLYNNFKNIIKIQLNSSATAESCGLSAGQFWAIKNKCINYYTKEELISIFLLITSMDKKIKSGEIPADMAADYMLVKILGV